MRHCFLLLGVLSYAFAVLGRDLRAHLPLSYRYPQTFLFFILRWDLVELHKLASSLLSSCLILLSRFFKERLANISFKKTL